MHSAVQYCIYFFIQKIGGNADIPFTIEYLANVPATPAKLMSIIIFIRYNPCCIFYKYREAKHSNCSLIPLI